MNTAIVLPRVQILPAAPQEIFFDTHQFSGKRPFAVTQASRIAFEDYTRMHQVRRAVMRCKRFIPAFAANDKQLRMVLAVAAWRYACGGRGVRIPAGIEEKLSLLIKVTDARFARDAHQHRKRRQSELQRRIWSRYRTLYVGPGAWMKVHSAVAFRSWRMGDVSNQVAEQLFMTPDSVRVILCRLNGIARALGYETFKPRKSRGWLDVVSRRGSPHPR